MLTKTMKPDAMQAARQRRLVGAVLEWPALLDHVDERFFSLNFTEDSLNALRDSVQSVFISRKAVDKQALHAHIESQGLSGPLRQLLRERGVLVASMGGKQADLAKRAALWMKEADTQEGRGQTDGAEKEGLNRMADALRAGNSEAMKRLMRAEKASRN